MPYQPLLLTPSLSYQNHLKQKQLYLEKLSTSDLAECYDTPCYIYSKQHIITQIQRYQQGLSGRKYRINYAVKASSNIHLLALIQQQGCGFDVVSGGEFERVRHIGSHPSQVVLSGVGKSTQELTSAISEQIHSINIESFAELERTAKIAQQLQTIANVSLRINPNINPKTHAYIATGLEHNKFGVDSEHTLSLYQWIVANPWLKPVGISCHIGSQLLDLAPLMDAVSCLVELTKQLEQHNIQLNFIDVGGGIGIAYNSQQLQQSLDWHGYFKHLKQVIPSHYEIHLEPGRSIIGNAGILLSKVEYLKVNTKQSFAVIDAAMNDLIRPALYQAHHEVIACEYQDDADDPLTNWQLVGPICESGDFLALNHKLPLKQHSLIAIQSAGAYCFSMSSNYNSRNRAAEVLVDGANHRLIRRRQTMHQQLAEELNLR